MADKLRGGSTVGGNLIWHTGNDGASSGLDADLLDGIDSSSFLRSDADDTFTNLAGTSLTIGAGVKLRESTDRADLLTVESQTVGWAGIQIDNTATETLWSLMADGAVFGIYDDTSNAFMLDCTDGGATRLYHAGAAKLATEATGVAITGTCTATSFNSITGLASVAPVAPAVTAVVGVSTTVARQDHVHPLQTTITGNAATATTATTANALNAANAYTGTSFNSMTGLASVAPVAPAVTAAVGTSTAVARQDHVHPTNFTATATDIKMNGTQAVGTLTTFARADHVHPVDTSRAATNQTMFIGTTSVAINRTTGSLALTGVSIDGNAATATNSSQLNGLASATAATASTIVARDSNGFINCSYLNSSRVNETTAAASYIYDTGDGYMRKKSLANVRAEIVTSDAIAASGYVGGATLSNDSATNAEYYPTMSTVTSGAFTTAKISSTELSFNPSTGTLSSTIFNATSDERKKDNIITSAGLEVVNKLRGVEFDWKNNSNHSAGVIAQEIEKIIPHAVSTNTEDEKSVNYNAIIGYLINSINELTDRVNFLEGK
jgi:hypothetical protein